MLWDYFIENVLKLLHSHRLLIQNNKIRFNIFEIQSPTKYICMVHKTLEMLQYVYAKAIKYPL